MALLNFFVLHVATVNIKFDQMKSKKSVWIRRERFSDRVDVYFLYWPGPDTRVMQPHRQFKFDFLIQLLSFYFTLVVL